MLPADEPPDRNPWRAMGRGLICRCPRCGKGRLFQRYSEQVEFCAVCGEPLAYYKVGLLLPFVVITVMIHIIAFVMLEMEISGRGSPLVYLLVLVPLAAIVPIAILPFAKGALIGLFWAKGWSDEQDR